MTTFGDMLYHLGGTPVGGPVTGGKAFVVAPNSGLDQRGHGDFTKPFASLGYAFDLVTSGKRDTVYLVAESNTSSVTTNYLTSALELDKDLVYVVGVNAGQRISQRSRVAWASTASASSDTVMFTVSGNSNYFENIQFYCGVDDANLSFNVLVSGDRNVFRNCHFAGIGHNTNDSAGAYSLCVTGSENVFESCVIGLDTIARGTAANSELLLASGGTGARNIFRNCLFITFAEANTHQFVTKQSGAIDRFVLFENCIFINAVKSSATQMAEAFDVTAGGSPNGLILLHNCSLVGCDDWEAATVSGEVYIMTGTAAANAAGLAVVVAAS